MQSTEEIINIQKFSSLDKLHKHNAPCLKFAKSRGNVKTNLDNDWTRIKLSIEDYKAAENYWVKRVSESVYKLYEAGKLLLLRPIAI